MRVVLFVVLLGACGPVETTDVVSRDRSFTPTATFTGKGTEIRDGINVFGGGRRVVDVIYFVATDADVSCADFVEGACGTRGVTAGANELRLDLEVRETLLGDGLGDYDVPSEAFVQLTFDDDTQAPSNEGQLELARFGDDGGAVSYSFVAAPSEDAPSIAPGAVVADRCAALDEVFVDCE